MHHKDDVFDIGDRASFIIGRYGEGLAMLSGIDAARAPELSNWMKVRRSSAMDTSE